jgi:hypothetical protein
VQQSEIGHELINGGSELIKSMLLLSELINLSSEDKAFRVFRVSLAFLSELQENNVELE